MNTQFFLKISLVVLFLFTFSLAAYADTPRFALVVGNAAYGDNLTLKNPVNDAQDVADSLKALGWQVDVATDVDRRGFLKAVGSFQQKLSDNPGAQALFFYAGHGLQLEGQNYLVPVKSEIGSALDVPNETVALGNVTAAMEKGSAAVSLIILDACRDNPFLKTASRSVATARGLTIVQGPSTGEGSVILYSTSPGDVANDGSGRNGLFTSALLKHLADGTNIDQMFKAVSADVRLSSGNTQKPWINSSLTADFFLSGKAAPAAPSDTRRPSVGTVSGGSGAIVVHVFLGGRVEVLGQIIEVPTGGQVPIDNLEPGNLKVVITHTDGKIEARTVPVEPGKKTDVYFNYKPAAKDSLPDIKTQTADYLSSVYGWNFFPDEAKFAQEESGDWFSVVYHFPSLEIRDKLLTAGFQETDHGKTSFTLQKHVQTDMIIAVIFADDDGKSSVTLNLPRKSTLSLGTHFDPALVGKWYQKLQGGTTIQAYDFQAGGKLLVGDPSLNNVFVRKWEAEGGQGKMTDAMPNHLAAFTYEINDGCLTLTTQDDGRLQTLYRGK